MKSAPPDPNDYPAFRGFLRGYLNQDYPEIHGDEASAAAAFLADASDEERAAIAGEAHRFRQATRGLSVRAVAALLCGSFGSAFAPRRRAELDALLAALGPGGHDAES